MAILWCGGEDIDFPNNSGIAVSTNSAQFRTGYARSAVRSSSSSAVLRSLAFPAGAITTCWFTFEMYYNIAQVSALFAGLVKDPTSPSGLWIGSNSSTNTKFSLYTYDGTTKTVLASESGTSLATGNLYRVDVQLVSYGASATVNVFVNNIQLITFTGDTRVTGVTSLSAAAVFGLQSTNNTLISEFVVADEDTRPVLGLLTMAATSTGTTNNWTNNTFTNVNPTTINDANATSVNTDAQDQQFNVTDEPSGTFAVKAVRIAARAFTTVGATANKIKLGFNSGGSVAVGTTQSVATSATTYEQLWDATNPVTSAAWGDSTEINALQIDLRSST